jgi:hypothetical protein
MKQIFRKLNLLACLLVALSIAIESAAQAQGPRAGDNPKTWVLAIGVSKYPKLPGGEQLQFADRDAADFADAIRKSGAEAENVRILIGADATTSAIKSAIGTWLLTTLTPKNHTRPRCLSAI